MSMLARLKSAAIIAITSASIVGCTTIKRSELPYFIGKLEEHSFTSEEKETIGELLRYINDLENR